jgi:hypothetical protein
LPIFQVHDSKVSINLDDFLSLSELVMQQPPIQLSQLTTNFYWNEKPNYALMDILKNNWDSPLEYVVSLFNPFCNTNITKKNLKSYSILTIFFEKNTNVRVNEILFNLFTLVPLIKALKNLKIQMEHSHLIIEYNVTQKRKKENFDSALYDNDIYELLEVCPNLIYYTKTFKFINMFQISKKDRKL